MPASVSSREVSRIDRRGPRGGEGFVDVEAKPGLAASAGLLALTSRTASGAVDGSSSLAGTQAWAAVEKRPGFEGAALAANLTGHDAFLDKLHAVNGLNVIFQVTDRCVLSCKYCFAKGSHRGCKRRGFMSPGLLEAAIRQSFDTRHAAVFFEWTGGESFLAGKAFYKRAAQYQERHANKYFTNAVQTSGYLLDKDLIDFFVDHRFHISLTIDGPAEVHDFNRPTPKNRPSLGNVLATRDYIAKKQGSCDAIVTVTKKTLGKEGAILDFFRSLGVNNFHSNPYVYFHAHDVGDEGIALSNEDYASYFVNQFNAWSEKGRKSPTPATLDYVMNSSAAGAGLPNALCTFGGKCLTNFVAIAPNGDAYLCPKFTGMKKMLLGNIGETSIRELLSERSPAMAKLIANRIAAINKCEKDQCRHLLICNSGCPYHSLIAGRGKNIKHRDWLCEGKTTVFDYLGGVVASLMASQGLQVDGDRSLAQAVEARRAAPAAPRRRPPLNPASRDRPTPRKR